MDDKVPGGASASAQDEYPEQVNCTTTDPLERLRLEYLSASGCCLHDPQFSPDDVRAVIYAYHRSGYYAESDTTMIVTLKDDQGLGYFTSSEDTTGHGCQCGSMTVKEPTLHLLLGHLTEQELVNMIRGTDIRVDDED